MPITHGDIGGAEPSTITFKVDTVTLSQNSTTVHREVLVVGDPQSSQGYATVLASAPTSTEFGLTVRQVGFSTIVSVANTVAIQGNSTVFIAGPTSTAAPATSDTGVIVRQVGYSTIVSVANTVTIQGNSSVVQNTNPWLCAITSPLSSAAPNTGDSGVIVRQVGYSTIVSVANTVTIAGDSSVVQKTNPWTIAGNSTVIQGTSPWVISGNSTVVQAAASNPWIVAEVMQSSVAPSSGSSGVIVRPVIDNILTTASSNAFGTSTAFTIQSSAAAIRSYVVAYSITCTNATATKLAFYSGSSMNWPIVLQAASSAVSGANLAVSAPAYLFRTNAADPLSIQMGGSSVAGFKVAVSYFRAP